jgi:hypothetical protein
MDAGDVIAQLVALERAAGRRDLTASQSMLLTLEEGVLDLERMTIATMRENALLRQRLETCGADGVVARPPTPGRPMPESRAHAG